MTLKLLLLVTGALAAIAVLVRGIVTVGLYLGILPGIVLAVAPTAFLYLLAFAVVRRLLPFAPGLLTNAAAAVTMLALGVAITLPMALAGRGAFAVADTGDVTPAVPVKLAGHIRLERDRIYGPGAVQSERGPGDGWRVACDALCAALLDTPGVVSVTLAGSDNGDKPIAPVTFRLAAPGAADPRAPFKPDEIVQALPEPAPSARRDFDAERAEREALASGIQARWALRLARDATLIAEPTQPAPDMTIVLRNTAPAGLHRIAVTEARVTDAQGRVLFRRQRVAAAPVAVPFHIVPEGPMLDRGWGLGRSGLYTRGERYGEVKPVTALFEGTDLARPQTDPAALTRIRERLDAAARGQGTEADLGMAGPWVATLDWRQLSDPDTDLLAALIANPKVQGLDRIYDGYEKQVSPRLRAAIAKRLLDPATDAKLRNRLNLLVRRMPAGTYASLLPDEDALLRDQELRLNTSALALRLADGGAASVPRLTALLEADVRVDAWWKRQWMMKDLCRAFSRLGPAAAPALPLVERLFNEPRNPLANDWGEAQAWRVAMVRMGKPIGTLPFPAHFRPEQVASDRENVARMAARVAEGSDD